MKSEVISNEEAIAAFAALGEVMCEAAAGSSSGQASALTHLAETLWQSNPWFTPDNVRLSLSAMGGMLTGERLRQWLALYPDQGRTVSPATVGVVMAGNIPLVGFHDMLCVLITGHRLLARLSTKDELLMRGVAALLTTIEPRYKGMITLTTGRLSGFDMVIATGSNNTSRYFEYYFRHVPSIIRRNRNSIAIIDGSESDHQLTLLGDDIFSYFGLGCRNVSKLYLPEGYDPASLLPRWHRYSTLRTHYKYDINYTHQKAVMIVNSERFIDGDYVLLKESSSLTPPMSVVSCQYYRPGEQQPGREELEGELLQCVAGAGHLPFGTTQRPELWDYADNRDTISFLLKKNSAG